MHASTQILKKVLGFQGNCDRTRDYAAITWVCNMLSSWSEAKAFMKILGFWKCQDLGMSSEKSLRQWSESAQQKVMWTATSKAMDVVSYKHPRTHILLPYALYSGCKAMKFNVSMLGFGLALLLFLSIALFLTSGVEIFILSVVPWHYVNNFEF